MKLGPDVITYIWGNMPMSLLATWLPKMAYYGQSGATCGFSSIQEILEYSFPMQTPELQYCLHNPVTLLISDEIDW